MTKRMGTRNLADTWKWSWTAILGIESGRHSLCFFISESWKVAHIVLFKCVSHCQTFKSEKEKCVGHFPALSLAELLPHLGVGQVKSPQKNRTAEAKKNMRKILWPIGSTVFLLISLRTCCRSELSAKSTLWPAFYKWILPWNLLVFFLCSFKPWYCFLPTLLVWDLQLFASKIIFIFYLYHYWHKEALFYQVHSRLWSFFPWLFFSFEFYHIVNAFFDR